MTFAQAKKELKSYASFNTKHEDLLEEVQRLKDKCTKVTTVFSDMPKGSYDVHRFENTIAEMIDKSNRLLDLIEEEQKTQNMIEKKLDKIEDPNLSALLHKRFVLGKSIYHISKDMNYTERWTLKLINNGISEYAKISS